MDPERQLALEGLSGSITRLRDVILNGTGYQHLIPTSEALSWVYGLHEWHRTADGPAFFEACRELPGGGELLGLVYARGVVTHNGLADPTKLVGRRPFRVGKSRLGGGDVLGGPGIAVYWVDLVDLPAPGRPERHGRDALYAAHVAGGAITDPLAGALDFLRSLPPPRPT